MEEEAARGVTREPSLPSLMIVKIIQSIDHRAIAVNVKDVNINGKAFIGFKDFFRAVSWVRITRDDAKKIMKALEVSGLLEVKRHGPDSGVIINLDKLADRLGFKYSDVCNTLKGGMRQGVNHGEELQ